MVWDGYNFEDAIIVSEELIREDTFTSIHIQHFEVEIRETKLGPRGVHARHPPTSRRARWDASTTAAWSMLGTRVGPGDILVRQGLAQEQVRADARGEAAARDLRAAPART